MAAGWYRWGMQLDFHKQMERDPETAQGIHSAASAARLSTVLCIYTNGRRGGKDGRGKEDGRGRKERKMESVPEIREKGG